MFFCQVQGVEPTLNHSPKEKEANTIAGFLLSVKKSSN